AGGGAEHDLLVAVAVHVGGPAQVPRLGRVGVGHRAVEHAPAGGAGAQQPLPPDVGPAGEGDGLADAVAVEVGGGGAGRRRVGGGDGGAAGAGGGIGGRHPRGR